MAQARIPFSNDIETIVTTDLVNGHLTGALIRVVQNIRALNDLFDADRRRGDGCSAEMCEGYYSLVDQQTMILAGITKQVAVWEEDRREAAAMAPVAEEENEAVRKVREGFIASGAEAGMHPKMIAQALNMRRSNVERVIGQLRGEKPQASRQAASA